ncbi:tyrosine-type recombinase/integrase, partial [Ralstonia pseudosolanacearum]|uniref:tyrosine-type recombinase/integrase n=1 Tax=Ralstonia pseudosolanacearum TaxID=1310165 RepID=UPI003CE82F24
DKQAKALLNAIKGSSLIALRDKAIIALALCTGLRTCEISRANRGDFKDAGDYWTIDVVGKGHQTADATVKVPSAVAELIQAYLDKRGNVADDEPLFASTSNNNSKYGNRYSEQSVGKMIKRMMIKVGINDKRISAHSTRHYCATCACKSGIDIREVGSMLRHSSIVVTSVYLHDISLETRRAEMAVADVLFCA